MGARSRQCKISLRSSRASELYKVTTLPKPFDAALQQAHRSERQGRPIFGLIGSVLSRYTLRLSSVLHLAGRCCSCPRNPGKPVNMCVLSFAWEQTRHQGRVVLPSTHDRTCDNSSRTRGTELTPETRLLPCKAPSIEQFRAPEVSQGPLAGTQGGLNWQAKPQDQEGPAQGNPQKGLRRVPPLPPSRGRPPSFQRSASEWAALCRCSACTPCHAVGKLRDDKT